MRGIAGATLVFCLALTGCAGGGGSEVTRPATMPLDAYARPSRNGAGA